MAVPKKKRYKQVIRTRRSLQQNQIFVKNKIILTKFKNYIITKAFETFGLLFCNFCRNKKFEFVKQLCVNCFSQFFQSLFLKRLETGKEDFRKLDYEYIHYVKLSETLLPLSGS